MAKNPQKLTAIVQADPTITNIGMTSGANRTRRPTENALLSMCRDAIFGFVLISVLGVCGGGGVGRF